MFSNWFPFCLVFPVVMLLFASELLYIYICIFCKTSCEQFPKQTVKLDGRRGSPQTSKTKVYKEVFFSNTAAVEKPLHTVKFKSSSHFQWTILKSKSTGSTIHLGKIFRFQKLCPSRSCLDFFSRRYSSS